jgi:hypothetical protein
MNTYLNNHLFGIFAYTSAPTLWLDWTRLWYFDFCSKNNIYTLNLTTTFLEIFLLFNFKKLNYNLKFRTIGIFLNTPCLSPEVRHRPHFLFSKFKTRHDVKNLIFPFKLTFSFRQMCYFVGTSYYILFCVILWHNSLHKHLAFETSTINSKDSKIIDLAIHVASVFCVF